LGIGSFGLGTIVAVVISWTTYHDVLWTIVHGFLSWAFIIWYLIFH
jgi:branched-subunit amino acid transport protein